jgi:hypothetical protein
MKMVRCGSITDDGRLWVILDGVSLIRGADGAWRRAAPPSVDDLKDNWYRASSSLLIRWLDDMDKVTPVKSNEQ